jgi:hypothetical protein
MSHLFPIGLASAICVIGLLVYSALWLGVLIYSAIWVGGRADESIEVWPAPPEEDQSR